MQRQREHWGVCVLRAYYDLYVIYDGATVIGGMGNYHSLAAVFARETREKASDRPPWLVSV